jgi:hypothetical protein
MTSSVGGVYQPINFQISNQLINKKSGKGTSKLYISQKLRKAFEHDEEKSEDEYE